MRLEITTVSSLPEVRPGDDLAALIHQLTSGLDQDVVVAVAQKVVSKAEGAIVDLRQIQPSALAQSWKPKNVRLQDARLIELILAQSRRIVKMDRGVIISETQHGFVCANAGDPMNRMSMATIRQPFSRTIPMLRPSVFAPACNAGAVIVTDTFPAPSMARRTGWISPSAFLDLKSFR